MPYWKFECADDAYRDRCLLACGIAPADHAGSRLQDTDAQVRQALAADDLVILGTLQGDLAQIYAIGKVSRPAQGPRAPEVRWAATRKSNYPDPEVDLLSWQTRTAFELRSPKADALRELAAYLLR